MDKFFREQGVGRSNRLAPTKFFLTALLLIPVSYSLIDLKIFFKKA